MHIRQKNDLLKYAALTTLSVIPSLFFLKNITEWIIVLCVPFLVFLNHLLLVEVVVDITQPEITPEEEKFSPAFMFIAKFIILIAALTFGVHFMGKRIIIPVLNYVVQIFILYFSFKKAKGNLS